MKPVKGVTWTDKRQINLVLYRPGSLDTSIRISRDRKMQIMHVNKWIQTKVVSAVLVAVKIDGTLQFCRHCRHLHVVEIGDTYATHHMDHCIDTSGDVTIFSTMDDIAEYGQGQGANKHRDKIALPFITEYCGLLKCHFAWEKHMRPFKALCMSWYSM